MTGKNKKQLDKLPKLKDRQLEILLFLHKFRFLNRPQIQTLLGHKGPRKINRWLKDLTKKKCTGRIYSQEQEQINKPAIYYLKKKSIKYLKNHEEVNPQLLYRIYREDERSEKFINHCITLADAFLLLKELETKDTKLIFFPKTDLNGIEYLPHPLPDAFLAVKINKKKTKRFFLDIFDENAQRFVYKKRLKQYIEYADGQEWEAETNHPFPAVIFICPDEASKESFAKIIVKEMEEEINEITFYLTVKDRINPKSKEEGIWEKVEYE